MNGMAWYLASPFFNTPQLELVKSIEQAFRAADIHLYSPRSAKENDSENYKPLPPEKAASVFELNCMMVGKCSHLIAVLDWKLPDDRQLRIVETPTNAMGQEPLPTAHIKGPPLNLPDSGTVFEMGYALALGKTVVCFTERKPEDGLNLMLTQGSRGVLNGLLSLKAFLNQGRVDWNVTQPWSGKNR